MLSIIKFKADLNNSHIERFKKTLKILFQFAHKFFFFLLLGKMNGIDDYKDPLTNGANTATESYASTKNIKLIELEQQQKLWELFHSDVVIQQVVNFIRNKVFQNQVDIIFPSKTPYHEAKINSIPKWVKFMTSAIDWLYMYGMIPWRMIVDSKRKLIYPEPADFKTGRFGYQKTRLNTTKAIYVTHGDLKKSESKSVTKFKVHVFGNRSISYDFGKFPSPFINMLPQFYSLNTLKEYEMLNLHRLAHPTYFIHRDIEKMKWGDITENQTFDPSELNALERHRQWLDWQNLKELKRTAADFNLRKDEDDIIRKVSAGKVHVETAKGRSGRFLPFGSGNKVQNENAAQWNFKIEYNQTLYENYVSNLVGLNREIIFGFDRTYVGNVKEMNQNQINLVVERVQTMLTEMFEEIWAMTFPVETDLLYLTSDTKQSLKNIEPEEKDEKKNEISFKSLRENFSLKNIRANEPVKKPIVDWKSKKKSFQDQDLKELLELYKMDLVSKEYLQFHVREKYGTIDEIGLKQLEDDPVFDFEEQDPDNNNKKEKVAVKKQKVEDEQKDKEKKKDEDEKEKKKKDEQDKKKKQEETKKKKDKQKKDEKTKKRNEK